MRWSQPAGRPRGPGDAVMLIFLDELLGVHLDALLQSRDFVLPQVSAGQTIR